jgi:hypothetical protein
MKAKIIALSFLCLGAGLAAAWPSVSDPAKLEFTAPSQESPFYRISGSFALDKGTASIAGLVLNGGPVGSYLVFRSGRPVDVAKPLPPGIYDIVLTYAWRSGKTYKLDLVYREDTASAGAQRRAAAAAKTEPSKERTAVWSSAAPGTGGIPDAYAEGFHAAFVVEETAGIDRDRELTALTVTAPKAELGDAPLAVLDAGQLLLSQVLERKDNVPSIAAVSTHPETTTIKLAIPVRIAARERKILIILKGGPDALPGTGPFISGEGLGRTIRTSRIALGLDPQSGQIATIEFLKEKIKLQNGSAGVIHSNPDVSVPGQPWDHTFDWNPPESAAEKNGPLVYVNARKGPLPRIKDIYVEVRYELEQEAPYVLVETRVTARKDLGVIALRNDQMVFGKRSFDTLIYKDPKEGVVERPLLELPDKPYGMVHVAPAEAEWVGLVNSFNRYGFFGVRVSSANTNLDAAGPFSHRAGTFFYAPSDADFVYWVRPQLATWGDYTTYTRTLFLPEGSEFYEKNAYLLLPMDERTPAVLDDLGRRLRNPVRVY